MSESELEEEVSQSTEQEALRRLKIDELTAKRKDLEQGLKTWNWSCNIGNTRLTRRFFWCALLNTVIVLLLILIPLFSGGFGSDLSGVFVPAALLLGIPAVMNWLFYIHRIHKEDLLDITRTLDEIFQE